MGRGREGRDEGMLIVEGNKFTAYLGYWRSVY